MSFIGRSIRNRYPLWSAIRKDDSSVGGRIIDSIGESIESIRVSGLRMQEQLKTLEGKPTGEPFNIWNFSLSDSDEYVRYIEDNKEYSSVSFSGEVNGETLSLKQAGSYDDLCLSYPTRISISLEDFRESFELLSLDSETFSSDSSWDFKNKIYKIYFDVKNSNFFFDPRTKEKFNYNYFITIRGLNIADLPIEETIYIKDDGFYETRNYFKKIQSLKREPKYNIAGGPSIEREGFDGEIVIKIKPYGIMAREYAFSLFVEKSDRINKNNSLIENKGFFELRKEEGYTYLDYIYRYYETGDSYRVSDIESPEAFQDILFSQVLLDNSGNNLEISDYCFDTIRNKLVTINADGVIRFYKIGKTNFNPTILNRTKLKNFTIETERQQASLYEEMDIYGYLERPKGPVVHYIVLKEKSGSFFCLQENLESWSEKIYLFSGRDRADLFENADSFKFKNYFDSIGQYNFHIISFTTETQDKILSKIKSQEIFELNDLVSKLNSYIRNNEQYEVYIENYSIMCEYSLAEYTLETGITGGELGVFYEGIDNTLYVIRKTEELSELFKIKEYKDYFIFDYETGEGGTLEYYEKVYVDVNNGSFLEEVTYD